MKSLPNKQPSPLASLRWPMIIVGLLVAHITLMMAAVTITLRHPGESAVVTDYYNKAQQWDSYKANLAAASKLGWKLDIQPANEADVLNHPKVFLTLTDQKNQAISNATLTIYCYHLAHGDQAASVSAQLGAAGSYSFTLPAKFRGFWEFQVTAEARNQTFICPPITRYIN